MKKRELDALREKNVKKLSEEVKKLQKEAILAAAKISAGQEPNLKLAKNMRIKIAKYKTIISEKLREEK